MNIPVEIWLRGDNHASSSVIAPTSYHRHYFVEFRPSPFMPWQAYGPYRSRGYAHDVARGLRAQGLQVRIVHR